MIELEHGLRGVCVHVCQHTGIRVHAIDWRDNRRGYAQILKIRLKPTLEVRKWQMN